MSLTDQSNNKNCKAATAIMASLTVDGDGGGSAAVSAVGPTGQ